MWSFPQEDHMVTQIDIIDHCCVCVCCVCVVCVCVVGHKMYTNHAREGLSSMVGFVIWNWASNKPNENLMRLLTSDDSVAHKYILYARWRTVTTLHFSVVWNMPKIYRKWYDSLWNHVRLALTNQILPIVQHVRIICPLYVLYLILNDGHNNELFLLFQPRDHFIFNDSHVFAEYDLCGNSPELSIPMPFVKVLYRRHYGKTGRKQYHAIPMHESKYIKLTEAEAKWPQFSRRHFQMHFLEWKYINFFEISLKFVPRGPINNILALVKIMAWCRQSYKPLSESMMIILLTHICVTRPQWVNSKPLWIIDNSSYVYTCRDIDKENV